MKLIDLVKAERVIESLADSKHEVGLSYKIMKLIKGMADDVEFYNKKAREIVQKYALKDKDGKNIEENGNIKLDSTKESELNKEVTELNSTEVQAPNIKIALSELQGLKLSVVDMLALDYFIKEEA